MRGPDVEIFLGASMSAARAVRSGQGASTNKRTIFFLLDGCLGVLGIILDGFAVNLDLVVLLLGFVFRLDDLALGRQFLGEPLQTGGMVDGVERIGPLGGSCGDLFLISE